MSAFLTATQIDYFRSEGYLVVEDVLPEEVLTALHVEYSALLDEVAKRLFVAGRLSSAFNGLPFEEKYVRMLAEDQDFYKHINISLPLENEMPASADMHAGPAVFGLMTHPRLLDVVESIIGREIYSNPVQHVRLKPPASRIPKGINEYSNVGSTPWHQDQAALLDEANDTQVLTVWVAITDATVDNGCLICEPRSDLHNGGELIMHCPGGGLASENYIPAPLLRKDGLLPLPVKKGGVVLFHQFTPHAALENKSDDLRWSFDLRFNPVGQNTGRPAFPGFVARSRSQPEKELRDPEQWAKSWRAALQRILSKEWNEQIYNEARCPSVHDPSIGARFCASNIGVNSKWI